MSRPEHIRAFRKKVILKHFFILRGQLLRISKRQNCIVYKSKTFEKHRMHQLHTFYNFQKPLSR